MVPVANRSPIPQVAWVFWLRPNAQPILEEFAQMLRTYHGNFHFKKQWKLPVPFGNTQLADKVSEFTNPQIPGTGELALIVFRDFFVLSNSGPLIQDIVRTRSSGQTGARSMRSIEAFNVVEAELPSEMNAFVWLHGKNLLPMFDDYLQVADADSQTPDQDWMVSSRPAAEDEVRRSRYPQYPSKASMPKALTDPGGEFDVAVGARLRELWTRERTSFTAEDRRTMQQLRAMAEMLDVAYLQLELSKDFVHYQARLIAARK